MEFLRVFIVHLTNSEKWLIASLVLSIYLFWQIRNLVDYQLKEPEEFCENYGSDKHCFKNCKGKIA